VYLAASRYRAKEGKLADAMQRSYERPDESKRFRKANRKSGRHEANITRIQGLTTWAAHAVFAAMVAGSLILGFDGVSRGTLEPAAVAILAPASRSNKFTISAISIPSTGALQIEIGSSFMLIFRS